MQVSKTKTVIIDLVTVFLSYGPFLLALYLSIFTLQYLEKLPLQLLIFPFLLQLSFVTVVLVFRLLLPSLKPGVYATGFNRGFIAWYTHSMLMRSARCFGLHYLLHSTSIFRFLYWRALGAKVPLNFNTSYKITLHDAAVVSIGEGTTLSEDVTISGHLVRGDKILVAEVKIGKNVFIGRNTYIGPRTRIHEGAWIGMGNTLSGDVIKENQRIDSKK